MNIFLSEPEVVSALVKLDFSIAVLRLYAIIPANAITTIRTIYSYEREQKIGQEQSQTKEEKFNYLRAWPVEEAAGTILYALTRYLKPNLILECGTSFGVSAIFFASALKENNKGKVITVEVSKLKHQAAQKNFQNAEVEDWVQQEKVAFDQYLKKLETPIDIVFLDCDRSRYAFYFKALLPYLQVGSLIIADNALDRAKDLAHYKELVEKDTRFITALITVGDGLLISKRLAI